MHQGRHQGRRRVRFGNCDCSLSRKTADPEALVSQPVKHASRHSAGSLINGRSSMDSKLTRRTILKAIPGGVATTVIASPYISTSALSASDPILIGVPTAQTAQAGVAD